MSAVPVRRCRRRSALDRGGVLVHCRGRLERPEQGNHENEIIAAEARGDLAYTVALEHTTASVNGAEPKLYVLRVTTVFRREDGQWKVVHRYGDALPDHHAEAVVFTGLAACSDGAESGMTRLLKSLAGVQATRALGTGVPGARSKRCLRRVQLKDGDTGSIWRWAAERGQCVFELLARPTRANVLLGLPHSDDVQGSRAPSPIAQWCRSFPTPVALPWLMINAWALS